MSSEGSITHWFGLLQAGDPAAAQPLWEHFFHRLVGLARKKLRGVRRAVADEEDVALSAFDTFCRRAEQGCFPQLADRDDLWRLLVVITTRKAAHLARREQRRERAARRQEDFDVEQLLGSEPTPEFAAEVADECRRLLRLLEDPELERLALLKMEGCTNEEIASRQGCKTRSVERKLRLIRDIWGQTLSGTQPPET